MIFKIDVDGVIRNIANPMCDLYNEITGGHMTPSDISFYDVEKSFPMPDGFGMSSTEFFFKKNAETVFGEKNKYGIYDGAEEALKMLKDSRHKVVICTWQLGIKNKLMTLKFLEKHGISYHDIMFTKDKWSVQSDFIIDDNPEFLFDEREKSDVKVVIDMPYNRWTIGTSLEKQVYRCKSLLEAAEMFKSWGY